MTIQESLPKQEIIIKDDITIMVGGQGGDGTLTVVNLFSRVFRTIGLNVYDSRNVLSRIRGGHADGLIRASIKEIYNIDDSIDILVAFEEEALRVGLDYLRPDGLIIYDTSRNELPSNNDLEKYHILTAPFGRIAADNLRRELFKNTVTFGLLGKILGFDADLLKQVVRDRYLRRGEEALQKNSEALDFGFKLFDEKVPSPIYKMRHGNNRGKIVLSGNDAVGYGFLVAGGRFFAGYPITPASDIMEWLQKTLPRFGGVVRQAEDELSVVNMAIGAAFAGARTMISTSGPGMSLITEGVGQAGGAEIPLVIVDCQRAGPTTGMPTKMEQSDLYHVVFGGHGDYPRLVLAPSTTEECFYMTVDACNLAEEYQLPVFLMLDQAIAQNNSAVNEFDLSKVRIDRGNMLTQKELEQIDVYKRYQFTDNGVSPRTVPGMKDGMHLATGNEHDEFGHISTDSKNRTMMMQKRMKKVESARKELPPPKIIGEPSAKIGFISYGSPYGAILEATEHLTEKGVKTKFLQLRTLWPLHETEISKFIDSCNTVYVVEHNISGQLSSLIKLICTKHNLKGIRKFDGTPFRPHDIVSPVLSGGKSR